MIAETDALAELLRAADPATPVPTCPGWSLAQIGTHVGRAQRWAAAMIAARATEAMDTRAVPDGAMPKQPEAAARWLSEGARIVIDAVDATGPEVPVWVSFGAPCPAERWIRRLLHEAVVHRADALLALDRPVTVDPAVAADGIDEWLELLAIGLSGRGVAALPGAATMHLHAVDPGLGDRGEWMIRPSGSSIAFEHGHAKGTVAVRGSATALLLLLMRRVGSDDPAVEIHGDGAVLTHWLAETPF
nr:maleylpyruvate isomerase family mycothiol-dependent enzyme [Nocardia bovistercoris]